MKKQAVNPYLPIDVYIPDGEAHVFGDRVYVYGSHDKEGGDKFCMLDYEIYSAPVSDLSSWSSKGVSYRAEQDPTYSEKYRYMYAPDCVKGNDGKYYLYYAMSGEGVFIGNIHVAVCSSPDGKFEYLGEVKNADGTPFRRNVTFDPAVINDDGTVRLYYGWALATDGKKKFVNKEELLKVEQWIFGKTEEEVLSEPDGVMGAFTVTLADDMLTVTSEPKKVAPGQFESFETPFSGHAFFEGSSIRKVEERYYFVYSSEKQHELCYAVSKYPDRDFKYGGVIISNGDIGYNGRSEKERLAATGNNHGCIENINGQWYVFYHRHTHNTSFSRQGCAEKIYIDASGDISQCEMTSCGLSDGALKAVGTYPAALCCNLSDGKMPHLEPNKGGYSCPCITNDGDERFISAISCGTTVGYKYFDFSGLVNLNVALRGDGGEITVTVGGQVSTVAFAPSESWQNVSVIIATAGVYPLYITYLGEGKIDIKQLSFKDKTNKII